MKIYPIKTIKIATQVLMSFFPLATFTFYYLIKSGSYIELAVVSSITLFVSFIGWYLYRNMADKPLIDLDSENITIRYPAIRGEITLPRNQVLCISRDNSNKTKLELKSGGFINIELNLVSPDDIKALIEESF